MVVLKDGEAPQPLDEMHRWDQLIEYNILDTVRSQAAYRFDIVCKGGTSAHAQFLHAPVESRAVSVP